MAHQSRLAGLVIDCKAVELKDAARFWGGALGCEIKWDDEDQRYALLVGPDDQPKMLLQAVDHDSRVHLDIETGDQAAEVARLEKLGAKIVKRMERWVIMEAPTGHRFCVVNPQRGDFAQRAKVWTD